eukprot:6880915-Alexandrium_andersonii.AAC.1
MLSYVKRLCGRACSSRSVRVHQIKLAYRAAYGDATDVPEYECESDSQAACADVDVPDYPSQDSTSCVNAVMRGGEVREMERWSGREREEERGRE